jgi:lipopolysaccharide transport system permease protein
MKLRTIRTITIKPKPSPFDIDWLELWESRDLLYFLTWRDIKVRYKQTVLGVLWIILQPLVSTVLFTFVFGNFAKIPSDNIPYPVFVYIGLLFWNFFSSTLTNASNSLVANENILKKVYFPRIISPIAATLSCVVDLLPVVIILGFFLIAYKVPVNIEIIILTPLLLLLVFIAALGLGTLLAPINAKFRDVRLILPYFIQLGLFATPVIYSTSLFGGTSKIIRIMNPVAEAVEVFRSSLFRTRPVEWDVLGISFLFVTVIFFIGTYYFRLNEENLVDIL